ncbi:hypothetical protein QYF61_011861 [Mycteria americana]|uniref:ribonuclease H n=1 Tax=Mycteria americana TaxID=33587 RepID=A0AAN7NUJ8_MYCAM|nr:hypothetical protein QYF61_011861 [Mycteria americana]
MLTQRLGAWRRAVGYFSKQLDNVSKGWRGCLRAVAATVFLIQEARKLTIGQKIIVYVLHMVIYVLEQKGGHWLSPSRMLKYQVILLEQDDVELKTTTAINPVMFLNLEVRDSELLHRDYLQTIEHVYSSRQDLRDEPLTNPDLELFTDGSSFVRDGKWMAGYAVVTTTQVIEAGALPINTSAQKAELAALRQALKVAEGKKVNIWTDSKYAFGIVHAHGAIWKERVLLLAQGSPIKYKEEILQLLQDIQRPKEVAVMHCKAHQFGQTAVNMDGTLLLNFDGSEGSQDLQPAPRDSRGEPPIPGLKNSEQDPLEQDTPRLKEEIPAEVEDAVAPLVWASGIPGQSKLVEPVKVVLKSGTKPVRQKQYPIKWEARKGLEELITKFLKYRLLIECESEYNTPILPVKKQNDKEYRLVQDLRAVNHIVQDIPPVVANPYTLLTSLKEKHKWFTVLDLKDAFFCIPLDKDSQAYLPLNGKAPPLDARHNSPGQCYLKGSKIVLQYLDCLQVTNSLLNFLGQAGYQVSKSKDQIGEETVIYLGSEISQGQRRLVAGRKEAICQVPEPRTIRELQTFLGTVGWCRLWILNYAALKGSQENHLLCSPECWTAFKNLKKALMSAPALGFPDLAKPFECLYMSDNILL